MTDAVDFETYVDTVERRLAERGFDPYSESPEGYRAETFHHRTLSLVNLGIKDVFCVVGEFRSPSVASVEEFSDRSFEFADDHNAYPWPVGTPFVVFPVAACEEPSENLKREVTGYSPSHWGAFEFPVVVDRTEGTVHYYTGTPLARRRAYAGFRKLAADAFDPDDADVEDLEDADLGGLADEL